ncbi:MAG: 30S ribosomal protein S27 [Planctomycetes bacterium]|nr:30S ribosomal protein S27 [Planctomycetota bacterium]
MHRIIQAAISTAYHLRRKCPHCKRIQVVKPSNRKKTVNCKFCGAKVPPDK